VKPYCEDLPVRIIRALQEEGMFKKSAATRFFGVSFSCVKR
jgi:hypothetical protein